MNAPGADAARLAACMVMQWLYRNRDAVGK